MAETAKQLLEDIQDSWKKEKEMYAMYLRKSRADLELEALGEGETLARHKAMLYEMAARLDIHPDQIVVYHEVVSGESIASRPEMQRLLNDVYQNMYAGVMVAEVERLARGNTKDQGEVADAFQYSHTKIITPSKIYDPNNEFDQEYFEFGLFMSRREYKTIKRRMEAGRMQSIQEGNYVGSKRPYGYDIKRLNKKERILVINEEEAPIVKMIFNWFTIDKQSAGWIARELTTMKIPTLTRKSDEWNRGTVVDILKNSHYIGNVRWNRRKGSKEYNVESGQLTKIRRRMTPDFHKEFKGKHQPIISKEQYDLAQTLFTDVVPVQLQSEIVNLFAGLLVCKDCGKAIGLQSYGNRPGTVPRYVHKGSVNCKKKSMPVQTVVDATIESLKAYIDDFEIMMTNDHLADEAENHAAVIEALEKELAKQEKKKSRLFESWEADDGTYTKEEFIERKQMYVKVIDDLKEQIKEMKNNCPLPVDYDEKIVTLHSIVEMLKDDNASGKSKNDFLKQYIERIDYDVIDFGRNKGGKPVLDLFLK